MELKFDDYVILHFCIDLLSVKTVCLLLALLMGYVDIMHFMLGRYFIDICLKRPQANIQNISILRKQKRRPRTNYIQITNN